MSASPERLRIEADARDGSPSPDALPITLQNSLASIEAGRLAILRQLEPQALGVRVINRLEVVCEEVISNIVRHGFTPGSAQTIAVALKVTPAGVEITFEDDGAPFDPVSAPTPPPFTTLDAAIPGGQGLVLIRRLSAAMRYETPAAPADRPFRPKNRLIVTIATTT